MGILSVGLNGVYQTYWWATGPIPAAHPIPKWPEWSAKLHPAGKTWKNLLRNCIVLWRPKRFCCPKLGQSLTMFHPKNHVAQDSWSLIMLGWPASLRNAWRFRNQQERWVGGTSPRGLKQGTVALYPLTPLATIFIHFPHENAVVFPDMVFPKKHHFWTKSTYSELFSSI